MKALLPGLFATLLFTTSCARHGRPPAPPRPMPAGVFASVGERTLTIGELRDRVVAEATRQQKSPDPCSKSTTCPEPADVLVRRVIDERIGRLVVEEHAAKTGIGVTDKEIEAELDRIVLFEFRPKEDVLEAAKNQGYADVRKTIGETVLLGKVWAAGPGKDPLPEIDTEAKKKAVLEAAYDTWKLAPEHQFVELRALAFHAPTKELVAHVTDSLTRLRKRAEAGEDFCALIKTNGNNDTDRNSCGTVGPLPLTLFPLELQKLIATMKPMAVAGPVPFQDAMALFQITDVPKPRPLEHVSRELWEKTVSEIQDRAIAAWLKRLGATYGLRTAAPDVKDLEASVADVRHEVPALDPQTARQQTLVREVVRNVMIKP